MNSLSIMIKIKSKSKKKGSFTKSSGKSPFGKGGFKKASNPPCPLLGTIFSLYC